MSQVVSPLIPLLNMNVVTVYVLAYICDYVYYSLDKPYYGDPVDGQYCPVLLTLSFFGSLSRSTQVTVWLTFSESDRAIRPPVRMLFSRRSSRTSFKLSATNSAKATAPEKTTVQTRFIYFIILSYRSFFI